MKNQTPTTAKTNILTPEEEARLACSAFIAEGGDEALNLFFDTPYPNQDDELLTPFVTVGVKP